MGHFLVSPGGGQSGSKLSQGRGGQSHSEAYPGSVVVVESTVKVNHPAILPLFGYTVVLRMLWVDT